MTERVSATVRLLRRPTEGDVADLLQLLAGGAVVAMWLAILSR